MWKNTSAQAMTLFCSGDSEGAVANWKAALENAKPTNDAELQEVAEISYCLGKCFADDGKDANAAFHLREAATRFAAINSAHNRLPVIQNELAKVLARLGKQDEAVSLFQASKNITPAECSVDLRSAIKSLQKQKLAADLNVSQLRKICKEAQIDIDGSNEDIGYVLCRYYYDEKHGADRSDDDLILITDYTQFETKALCEYICALIGQPNFLSVSSSGPFEQWGVLEFTRHDGKKILKACASAVGIVNVFNEQMMESNCLGQFRILAYSPCLMAYLLPDETYEILLEEQTLQFED